MASSEGQFLDVMNEPPAVEKSPQYVAQERRLVSIQRGFSAALAVIWLAASRSKAQIENCLSFRFTHDAFQTMAAVTFLGSHGLYGPAKRELRYFLESVVKHAHVDLAAPGKSLDERLAFLESSVPRSSVDFIQDIPIYGLSAKDAHEFQSSVKSEFARLSRYVHRSPHQLREELLVMGRGSLEPKHVVAKLEQFNRECFAVYDMAVFLQMQVLGPGLSGDVFVLALDDVSHWPFHKGRFTRRLSKFSLTSMSA